MPINQGDVYCVTHSDTSDIPPPYVVIQENVLNHSRLSTIVACALTSSACSLPGNILLEAGEANLPRPSVVEVSKVISLDKAQLGSYIGSLSEPQVAQNGDAVFAAAHSHVLTSRAVPFYTC
jgi:mRNA interferase MazF